MIQVRILGGQQGSAYDDIDQKKVFQYEQDNWHIVGRQPGNGKAWSDLEPRNRL